MGWIYIIGDNGGTFGLEASPDPQEIITLDEINAQISELQEILASIPTVVIPETFPEEIVQAGNDLIDALEMFSMDMTDQLNILLALKAELEALIEE